MLANVHTSETTTPETPSAASRDRTAGTEATHQDTDQLAQTLATLQEEQTAAAVEAATREREFEESLRDAQEVRPGARSSHEARHFLADRGNRHRPRVGGNVT